MTAAEKRIVLLTGLAHAHAHACILVVAPLIPLVSEEYGTGALGIGWAVTIMGLFFGFGSLPGGVLSDRFGSRRLLLVFLLGSSGALYLVSVARSFAVFSLGLALVGVAASVYHPSGLALISTAVRERGKALGIHGVVGNVGIALAPLLAAVLADWLGGWRWAFRIMVFPGILLGAALLLLGGHVSCDPPTRTQREAPPRLEGRMIPTFILLYAVFALVGFCYRGAFTYLPSYMNQMVDLSFLSRSGLRTVLPEKLLAMLMSPDGVTRGGLATTLGLTAGIAGQYSGGWLSDRFRLEGLLAGVLLAAVPLLLLMGLLGGGLLLAATIGFCFLHFCQQPVRNALVARYSAESYRSRAYGVSFFVVFGIGSLGAGFSGFVADRAGGLGAIFLALAGVVLFAAILAGILAKYNYLDRSGASPKEGIPSESVDRSQGGSA
jgi:MFS family permease